MLLAAYSIYMYMCKMRKNAQHRLGNTNNMTMTWLHNSSTFDLVQFNSS